MILSQYIPTSIRDAFTSKVSDIAKNLGIVADWLMIIMFSESSLKPDAVNPKTGATGLIQFMPATAKGLGTTTTALKGMDSIQQLNYVEKYFQPYKGKYNTLEDLYLTAFYPLALSKPDTFIIGSEKGMAYAALVADQNPGVYKNSQGYITKGTFKKWVLDKKVPAGVGLFYQKKK